MGLLAGLAALAACDSERDSPERQAERAAIARGACIYEELATNSRSTLTELERLLGATGGQVGAATLDYTRAYTNYAELRASAAAYLDSAVNYARTSADSLRFVQTGAKYLTSPPDPGTLQANVFAAHARDFRIMQADTANPCNEAVR